MFAAPLFLLGLMAIGVPLWLHRIARAEPTRRPFASLMFLRRSETLRTSRRTLRYWLLLALRILLLIAIVLAFAGPLLPETAVTRMAGSKLHAVVLDRSLSMQHADRWQRALGEAARLIDAVPADDQILLVSAAGRRVQVIYGPARASSRAAARGALRDLQPGLGRLDYGFLMSTANAWLGAQRPSTELHLITDLQQSATPLQFADLEPPEHTHLNVIDVSGRGADNAFIQEVMFAAENARSLAARVQGTPGSSVKREAVLTIDGTLIERRNIALDAKGQQIVVFSPHDMSRGAHRVEVSLEPQDSLAADDRFRVVIEQSNPAVLLVSHNTNNDEVAYLAAAIESLPSPRLDVRRITSNALPSQPLTRYSAVIVSDSASLSETARDRIREYASAGGAVLVTLGTQVTTPSVENVSELPIREVIGEPSRVAAVEDSHPILREGDAWRSIRFFRHVRVEPADEDKVLMSFEDGAPLLMERKMGQGRLLLFAAPLHRDWSDLATHPLFVRFIGDAASWLTASNAWPTSTVVDKGVATGLTASSGGQIFDPAGARVVSLETRHDYSRLYPEHVGFYEIRRGDEVKWLAVNVDPRESNLARMPEKSLQRWLAMRDASPAPVASEGVSPDARKSIGWWLLLIGAVVIAIEFILANHYLAVRREVPT